MVFKNTNKEYTITKYPKHNQKRINYVVTWGAAAANESLLSVLTIMVFGCILLSKISSLGSFRVLFDDLIKGMAGFFAWP